MPLSHLSCGERLSAAIKASPFSQALVAKRLGISRQGLNDIISGRSPGSKHMGALASMLGVEVGWLVHGEGPLPEHLTGIMGVDPDTMATDAVARFYALVREAGEKWNELAQEEPNEFERRLAAVPSSLQPAIKSKGMLTWNLTDLGDVRAAAALVGVEPDDATAFKDGHQQIQMIIADRRQRIRIHHRVGNAVDVSLPSEQFSWVRAGLLGLRAQRIALRESIGDANRTLAEIWRRQLTAPWPTETANRLESMRAEDMKESE